MYEGKRGRGVETNCEALAHTYYENDVKIEVRLVDCGDSIMAVTLLSYTIAFYSSQGYINSSSYYMPVYDVPFS